MSTVIKAEGIAKRYWISHQKRERYSALRDVITNGVKSVFVKNKKAEAAREEFWALKDINFEVKQGDRIGIIGRNGAGKSTLLKVLSRITEPTRGRISLKGRVASLLEVGTGFHPELTGRENIYLNGAIVGMGRREIREKFDEIVAFAEVEKFLDTPVKHYSSGMYIRLAFSVAAHIDPEIFLVDEVLAVGDVKFQKKCLGKMEEVSKAGRTVLFVSHNMAAVANLCQRGIVLQGGQVRYIGNQTDAISYYLKDMASTTTSLRDRKDRRGSGEVRVTGIEIRDAQGNKLQTVVSGQDISIHFSFETKPGFNSKHIVMSCLVKTQLDAPVFLHHNRLSKEEFDVLPKAGVFICRFSRLPLPPATYRIHYSIIADRGYGAYLDLIDDAVELTVTDGDFFGSGEVPPSSLGVCLVEGHWSVAATPISGVNQ